MLVLTENPEMHAHIRSSTQCKTSPCGTVQSYVFDSSGGMTVADTEEVAPSKSDNAGYKIGAVPAFRHVRTLCI